MRVLLVKLSSMGDVIHTLPAITDAANAIPGIKFTWVIEQGFQEIAYWHPAVERVIPIALRKRSVKQILLALKQIRLQHYDLVIDAQGLIKSAVLARLARASSRVGFDRKSCRESIASVLYNKSFFSAREQHAVHRLRQLFAQAIKYALPTTVANYGLGRHNFASAPQKSKPYIVFLHGTTWQSKHWPDEYWLALADLVADHGLTIQVTWATPEQKARAQALAAHCPSVVMLPHLTLNQAVDVLSAASGVVAVDTGFAHLSAALEKPMVAIYGATDVQKAGTVGRNNINLAAKFACAPCSRRVCTYTGAKPVNPPCLQQITPQIVWQHLRELIGESAKLLCEVK